MDFDWEEGGLYPPALFPGEGQHAAALNEWGRAAPSPLEGPRPPPLSGSPYCRSIDGLAPANARKTGRLRRGGGLEGSPPPPVGNPFIRHPTDHIYECTGRE